MFRKSDYNVKIGWMGYVLDAGIVAIMAVGLLELIYQAACSFGDSP